MNIKDIIAQAEIEAKRKYNRLLNIRNSLSINDFKKLFIIRAQQVMTERKVFVPFIIDENNREVFNLFYAYIQKNEERINPEIGIILNGAYGCGKSIAISAFCMLLNDLAIYESDKISEYHSIDLCELIVQNGVHPFVKQPILIQDIGKEMKEAKNFGTDRNPLTELFAVRSEYGSVTFGSTNYDKDAFEKNYKNLGKRLFEHSTILYLPGGNRRKDNSINQPVKK